MRKTAVAYVLTTFSPTMFGDRASVHLQTVPQDVATTLVNDQTQIVATRPSHENLARDVFGDLRTTRYADMVPEKSAILIHYRGAPISDNGQVPDGGTVTYYLIESEEYLELEE
jgi:hypothetical protein